MKTGCIVACSGSHGTGKTTRALELARDLKIQYPDRTVGVIQEIASLCPGPINQGTTEVSQRWIFATQMAQELEMSGRYDIVVADRTVVDAVAYTWVAGYRRLADAMLEMARNHLDMYAQVHFRTVKENPYHFQDGVRDSNAMFRQHVEMTLLQLWGALGVNESENFITE